MPVSLNSSLKTAANPALILASLRLSSKSFRGNPNLTGDESLLPLVQQNSSFFQNFFPECFPHCPTNTKKDFYRLQVLQVVLVCLLILLGFLRRCSHIFQNMIFFFGLFFHASSVFFPNCMGKDLNITMLNKSKESKHPQLAPCFVNHEKAHLAPFMKGSHQIHLAPCLKGDRVSRLLFLFAS